MAKTPQEKDWLARARFLGCMIANDDCGGGEIQMQHITDGTAGREGHLESYPLCKWHHHWDSPLPVGHAYHKGPKAWIEKHGEHEIHLTKARAMFEVMEPLL